MVRTAILRKAVAESTVAAIDLVDAVGQPTHFENGDDVVPTGDPASGSLGKRPPAEGVETTEDVFPETGDPDSGDAVAHVAYPDEAEAAPTYKSPGQVAMSAGSIAKSLVEKKEGIADNIRETMDDLGGALEELRDVEQALVARQERTRAQEGEVQEAREIAAAAVR